MLDKLLDEKIKAYPDFPKKGIMYRDVLPILSYPDLFSRLIDEMSDAVIYKHCDSIIAVDARGFIFGSAIANTVKKPLILARKKNKLPGLVIEKSYGLEYGKDTLCVQSSAIKSYNKFVIVDDLLATGGTAQCIIDILNSNNKEILALSVIIELTELNGSSNLGIPVYSEIKY